MIVIHPYDKSTRFLNLLYDKPKPDLTEEESKHEVEITVLMYQKKL